MIALSKNKNYNISFQLYDIIMTKLCEINFFVRFFCPRFCPEWGDSVPKTPSFVPKIVDSVPTKKCNLL